MTLSFHEHPTSPCVSWNLSPTPGFFWLRACFKAALHWAAGTIGTSTFQDVLSNLDIDVFFTYHCLISHVEPTLCWMNWKDPENSSLPHPAVQHLQTEELKIFIVNEDDILTLLQMKELKTSLIKTMSKRSNLAPVPLLKMNRW